MPLCNRAAVATPRPCPLCAKSRHRVCADQFRNFSRDTISSSSRTYRIRFDSTCPTSDHRDRGAPRIFPAMTIGISSHLASSRWRIRQQILSAFEAAETSNDPRPSQARVILIEAGLRLLPAFSERSSAAAKRAHERLGVEVRVGKPVTACDADGVMVGGERIEARSILWAAGVAASPPVIDPRFLAPAGERGRQGHAPWLLACHPSALRFRGTQIAHDARPEIALVAPRHRLATRGGCGRGHC